MKKKVLLFLIVVSALVGGGYAITQALFSDTETSQANTFAAGTLDMTVNAANGTAFDSIVVDNIGVDGTVTGEKEWTIRNTGTVPGNLTFRLNNVTNSENGCNEPELVTEPACEADTNGELGAATAAVVKIDTDGDGDYDEEDAIVNSTLATANQGQYATQWNNNAGIVTIPAGGSVKVRMDWANDPATYGNEIQSDGLSFQVQFDLTQVNPS